ncbi:MAG TPA: hypothetical protein VGF55_15335 [Gemmataceae bacterium]|jgi:hypothetical protein
MPPPPPQPTPPTPDDAAHPDWQPADIFRAVLFGALAVIYAVLLFPLAVVGLVLWLAGKVITGRPASDPPTPSQPA